MTERKTISRRGVLVGIASIGAAATGAGIGTHAYLSDQGETELSIDSGSIVLQTTEAISVELLEDSVEVTITVTNDGTLPARRVHLEQLAASGHEGLLAATEVLSLTWKGTEIRGNVERQLDAAADANGNGLFDLEDLSGWLAATENAVALEATLRDDGEPGDGIPPGESASLTMTLQIDYSQEGMVDAGPHTVSLEALLAGSQEPLPGDSIVQATPVDDPAVGNSTDGNTTGT